MGRRSGYLNTKGKKLANESRSEQEQFRRDVCPKISSFDGASLSSSWQGLTRQTGSSLPEKPQSDFYSWLFLAPTPRQDVQNGETAEIAAGFLVTET
jgi:hypothetical protein